jgi:hypothetical protein
MKHVRGVTDLEKLASQWREDALFLGPRRNREEPPGTAIGHAAIQQGYQVLYRETHASDLKRFLIPLQVE